MDCKYTVPAGINRLKTDCYESSVVGFALTKPDEKFAVDEILNLQDWKDKLETLLMWVPQKFASYEVTTPDPTAVDDMYGVGIIERVFPPKMTAWLGSNVCDFTGMLKSLSSTYGVWLILEDGVVMYWEDSLGESYGFTANADAITKGVPLPSELNKSNPVFVNYKSYDQFKNRRFLQVPWDFTAQVASAMPESTGLASKGAYDITPGTLLVDLFYRCGDAVLEADAIFEVLSSNNLVSAAVTATQVVGVPGRFSLLIQKEVSPVSLAAGDWVVIRQKDLDSSVVVSVSNDLYVQA